MLDCSFVQRILILYLHSFALLDKDTARRVTEYGECEDGTTGSSLNRNRVSGHLASITKPMAVSINQPVVEALNSFPKLLDILLTSYVAAVVEFADAALRAGLYCPY